MSDQPRAFRIDEIGAATPRRDVELRETPDVFAAARPEDPIAPRARRGFGWFKLFLSAAGGLALLGLSAAIVSAIADLIRTNFVAAYAAMALAALAAVGLVGFALREAAAIWRAARIEGLAREVAAVRVTDDLAEGRRLARRLVGLYAGRPETARARANIEAIDADMIDGRARLAIAERELMSCLDAQARAAVATAASRVALVTSISPRALVDVLFVLGVGVTLVRRISEIYGGRPGLLGFLRVARKAIAHLTITGGVAIGDSVLQQLLGAGVAARLSARLGEGVLNGLLTARVGLAAIAVCRPMGFEALPAPGLADVAGSLLRKSEASSA